MLPRKRRRASGTRTWWRAAASVRCWGVAVVAWRELGGPGVTPASLDAIEVTASRSAPESAVADSAAPPPPRAVASVSAPAARERAARDTGRAAGVAANSAVQSERRSEQQVKAFEALPAAPASGALGRSARATPDDTALVQASFPAEFASDAPPALLWLVQDAAGTVLRKGTLTSDDELPRVTQELRRDYPDAVIGAWNLRTLVNAQGRSLTLVTASATARTP